MEYRPTFVAWREGFRAGKLLGLKCRDCEAITCPPRKVCAECGGENHDIIEIQGRGQIISFTVCYTVPTGFEGTYVVAIADLEGGGRVMGNVLDVDPTKTGMEIIGKKVNIGFKEIPGDYMTGQDTRLALTFRLV